MLHNRSFTDEQFIEAIKTSTSIAQVLRKLSLSIYGSNYRASKILIDKLKLDTSHFTGQGHLKGKSHNWNKKTPLSEILIENSLLTNTTSIKKRLIKEGIKEYKCTECGITNEWNGKQLKLQLDHINGNNRDQRESNLRFLCPNCHSQTPNFCSKNRKYNKKEKLKELVEEKQTHIEKEKHFCLCGTQINTKSIRCSSCANKHKEKISWPSKEELTTLVWNTPMESLAISLRISDRAIAKRCKKENITKPPQGYWLRKTKCAGMPELIDGVVSKTTAS